MAITPEQYKEMQERVVKARQKPSPPPIPPSVFTPVAEAVKPVPPSQPKPVLQVPLPQMTVDYSKFTEKSFVYYGKPIGKPRMTQRDTWQKRPRVMRYREFADNLRLACGSIPCNPDIVLISAFVPMADSWPEKKKSAMAGTPCRFKPDCDNITKAVKDALLEDDACVWKEMTSKHWCRKGDERLEIFLLYAKS